VSASKPVAFDYKGLHVEGSCYTGDADDGFVCEFECESITLGDTDLPDWLYSMLVDGKEFDGIQEAAFEQARNGE
jgi:hypothetical protein